MAAGIGSRFGTGIKQLEPVDDEGHIIMDYSIHDALEAGFNHVVFIIRKDIEQEFKEVIGERIKAICAAHDVTVDYAFQDINDIPGTLPEGRTKPWGTGQAVLVAKKVIKTPFIVINADDYYGKEGFKAVHEYLVNGGKSCMAGFVLKNTLSDNGGVTRGICKMDEDYNLTEVVETKNIVKTAAVAEAEGMAVDVDSLVSMNMWGLTPDFLTTLEEGFKEFFEKEVPGNPLKAEYLIPIFIGELLEHGKMSVKVLKTNDTCPCRPESRKRNTCEPASAFCSLCRSILPYRQVRRVTNIYVLSFCVFSLSSFRILSNSAISLLLAKRTADFSL